MTASVERRSRTPGAAQDLASKYARAKTMLREQIESNQALRLALKEEQRQRKTLADGLEAERAATAAAVRRVHELEVLLAEQRTKLLATHQVDAPTQTDGNGPSDPAQPGPQRQQAAPAADAAQQRSNGGASRPETHPSHPAGGGSAQTEAAAEAVRQQSHAAQQRLCEEMAAALRQLQAEAQQLATQTREATRWQQRQRQQCIRC